MQPIGEGFLYSLLPEGVKQRDATIGGLEIQKYLSLFDGNDALNIKGELKLLKEAVDGLASLADIDTCPPEWLPYIGYLVGVEPHLIGQGISDVALKEQIRWAVRVWKNKGSRAGILFLCRTMFGLPTEIRPYRLNILKTWHELKNNADNIVNEPRTWDSSMDFLTGGNIDDNGFYTYGYRYEEGNLGFWISPASSESVFDALAKVALLEETISTYISITTTPKFVMDKAAITDDDDDSVWYTRYVDDIFSAIDFGVLEDDDVQTLYDSAVDELDDTVYESLSLVLGDFFEEVISLLQGEIPYDEVLLLDETGLTTHRFFGASSWSLTGTMTYADESTEYRVL